MDKVKLGIVAVNSQCLDVMDVVLRSDEVMTYFVN